MLRHQEPLGALLGRSCEALGASLDRLGTLLGRFGALLGRLGVLLGAPEALLEGSRKGPQMVLERSCLLGPSWDRFGTVLGPSWDRLGGSWEGLGTLLGRLGAVLRGSVASWRGFGAVLKASEGYLNETCETQ